MASATKIREASTDEISHQHCHDLESMHLLPADFDSRKVIKLQPEKRINNTCIESLGHFGPSIGCMEQGNAIGNSPTMNSSSSKILRTENTQPKSHLLLPAYENRDVNMSPNFVPALPRHGMGQANPRPITGLRDPNFSLVDSIPTADQIVQPKLIAGFPHQVTDPPNTILTGDLQLDTTKLDASLLLVAKAGSNPRPTGVLSSSLQDSFFHRRNRALIQLQKFKDSFNLGDMDPTARNIFLGQLNTLETAALSFSMECYKETAPEEGLGLDTNHGKTTTTGAVLEISISSEKQKPLIYRKEKNSDLIQNETTQFYEMKGPISFHQTYHFYSCNACGRAVENVENHFAKCEYCHFSKAGNSLKSGSVEGRRKPGPRSTLPESITNTSLGSEADVTRVSTITDATHPDSVGLFPHSTGSWGDIEDFRKYYDSTIIIPADSCVEPVEGIALWNNGIQCLMPIPSGTAESRLCCKVFATEKDWQAHQNSGPKSNGHKFGSGKLAKGQSPFQTVSHYQQVFSNNKFKKLVAVEVTQADLEYLSLDHSRESKMMDLFMSDFQTQLDRKTIEKPNNKVTLMNSGKLAANMNDIYKSLQKLDEEHEGFMNYLQKVVRESQHDQLEVLRETFLRTIIHLQNQSYENAIFNALRGDFG